jgi:type IV secretion system protein VirB2
MKATMKTHANFKNIAAFILLIALAITADAQILGKSQDILQQVADGLKALGVVIITIALMWAGYKIAYRSAQLTEVAMPLAGGIIIGSASIIAGLVAA